MRALILILFAHLLLNNSFSQDAHFTQIDKTISYLNPAMVGNFEGFGKITAQNRNQWINSGTSFSTSYFMGEMNIGKKKKGLKSYTGIGAYFLSDIGGISNYGIKTFGLASSGNIPLARGQWISGGLNISLNQQAIDLSKVTFASQWNGTVIDPNLPSGENMNMSSAFFPDAGAGLAFNFQKPNNSAFDRRELRFQGGVSLQHLNRPKINFSSLEKDNMQIKIMLHSLLSFSVTNSSLLEMSVAQFVQGPHKETILGAYIKTRLKESSQFTSLVSSQFLSIGTYFRSMLDICPYFALDLGPFRIGMAYDINLRPVTRGSYRQSIEFQLAYQFTKDRTLRF